MKAGSDCRLRMRGPGCRRCRGTFAPAAMSASVTCRHAQPNVGTCEDEPVSDLLSACTLPLRAYGALFRCWCLIAWAGAEPVRVANCVKQITISVASRVQSGKIYRITGLRGSQVTASTAIGPAHLAGRSRDADGRLISVRPVEPTLLSRARRSWIWRSGGMHLWTGKKMQWERAKAADQ